MVLLVLWFVSQFKWNPSEFCPNFYLKMSGVELLIEKDNANVACHICLKMFDSFYDA